VLVPLSTIDCITGQNSHGHKPTGGLKKGELTAVAVVVASTGSLEGLERGGTMFVDMGMLHFGAAESTRAGEHAQTGGNHLARASMAAEMFGDFVAAQALHETVTTAHAHHVKTLESHQEFLTGIGRKASYAADDFTATEDRNATALRDVWCS
jgi:hypothetical protein